MSKLIDLTGQDFGYWHVIKRAQNTKQGRAKWLCLCTACGNEKVVDGAHLRAGRTTNCGCIRMQKMRQASIKHEEGKTYGFLYVNRMATEEQKPRQDRTGIYWNCTCTKCGRENVIVFGDYLRKGQTISCGCVNSKNESLIAQMLNGINIKYIEQYKFDDLTLTGRACDRLMFDFAIFNEQKLIYLIEYDGIQHFNIRSGFHHATLEQFKTYLKRDFAKNKYCFEHNIPLIRIPYDEEYDLNDLKLQTTRFLLTPQNQKQYYLNRIKL